MKKNDKEMIAATQIAYLHILEKAYENIRFSDIKKPYSIKDMILSSVNIGRAKEIARVYIGEKAEKLSLRELMKYSDIEQCDKEVFENLTDEMMEWKIADIHDANGRTGMYGMVIETNEEEAIVAFRGSENYRKTCNLVNDWIQADIGLLKSPTTIQQAEVENYQEELIENGTLNKYSSVAVTGHSLGGNLASHFTVVAAKKGREDLFNKIDQTINMDGPGVSLNYLKKYEEDIKIAGEKIDHYKWSLVGSTLNGIKGEREVFLGIDEDKFKEDMKKHLLYKIIWRHDTRSLKYDENNRAIRGDQDISSKIIEKVSKKADEKFPTHFTQGMIFLIANVVKHISGNDEEKNPVVPKDTRKIHDKILEFIRCVKDDIVEVIRVNGLDTIKGILEIAGLIGVDQKMLDVLPNNAPMLATNTGITARIEEDER